MYSPLYLITKPMTICLDYALGREMGTVLGSTELMEMLKLQISLGACNEEDGEVARQVAEGALGFRDKCVEEVMTPLDDAYMLSQDKCLNYETIREIFETGYSRIPVYGTDKNDYRGLLYTKDLMLADPEDEMKLGDFIQIFQRKVETFFKHTKLVEVLTIFKKGGTHMGLVREPNTKETTNSFFEVVGVLTLEDVVEEILQDEIVDETDVFVDVDKQVRVADGRGSMKLNLGIFNPVWRQRREVLEREEVAAISKHLIFTVFGHAVADKDLRLTPRAVEFLIASSEVRNRERVTPLGKEEMAKEDRLYEKGQITDRCILILQGKVKAFVGREGFPSERGSFTILALDALRPKNFAADFEAFICTKSVRYISITKDCFEKAKELDQDQAGLELALCALAAEAAGEHHRKENKTGRGEKMPFDSDRDRNEFTPATDTCAAPLACLGLTPQTWGKAGLSTYGVRQSGRNDEDARRRSRSWTMASHFG